MSKVFQEKSSADYKPEPKDAGRESMGKLFEGPRSKGPLSDYRLLSPSCGLRVSPICLGAMSVGDQWEGFMAGGMNQEVSDKYLDFFYENGGNFIDTANNYQDEQSEHIIGEWMEKRGVRDDIVLATKYTTFYRNRHEEKYGDKHIAINYQGNHKKSLKHSLDHSLKKLRTDYVDILYVHWWDHSTSIPELMQSLAEVVRSGKVLYLGVSDTPAWVVSQANEYARNHALPQFVVFQGMYNLAARDIERDILPMCRNNGMSLAPWAVMGGGLFKSREELAKKQTRGGGAMKPTEEQLKVCDALQEVANEIGGGVKLAHVAMAFVRQQDLPCFPILGGTSIEYMKSNIEALNIHLTDAQMEKLNEASPFDHGFPTGRFTLDPRLLPERKPNAPLMKNAGTIIYPKYGH